MNLIKYLKKIFYLESYEPTNIEGDLYYINNMGLPLNDDKNFSNSDSKKIIINTINRGKLYFIII